MDHDLFVEVAEALHGPLWVRALAASLDVNERTVQRWRSQDTALPDWLPGELAVRLVNQAAVNALLLKRLQKSQKKSA